MEFTFALFPLMKAAIFVVVVILGIYTAIKEMYKTSIVIWLLTLVFVWFAPIKYDGTNTIKHHKDTVNQRSAEYHKVNTEAVVVTKTPLSFSERLKLEAIRSKQANDEIAKQLQE